MYVLGFEYISSTLKALYNQTSKGTVPTKKREKMDYLLEDIKYTNDNIKTNRHVDIKPFLNF